LIKSRFIHLLMIVSMVLLLFLSVTGCIAGRDFNTQTGAIIRAYRFSIVKWEIDAVGNTVGNLFHSQVEKSDGIKEVTEYFANVAQMQKLEKETEAVKAGNRPGDVAAIGLEMRKLQKRNTDLTATVQKTLGTQIRQVFSQQGIYNPFMQLKFGFPAIKFKLKPPPHLLVISPRDRIESIKQDTLVPDIDVQDMENIENRIDKLGVSSLVVEIGGFAAYPSYITDTGDLKFTIDAVAEEWLHQYLAFKPLGLRYLLHLTGIHRNYNIVTMNETLASIVGKEIGDMVYQSYYSQNETGQDVPGETGKGFDFNGEMREIRKVVDSYLARGEIKQAEQFMEQKRQYLATNSYYIRKLNQAYFAYYGNYADSPISISPIGVELKELRSRSASLKDFLSIASAMTSRQDLAGSVK
jgi:hypothetical protein